MFLILISFVLLGACVQDKVLILMTAEPIDTVRIGIIVLFIAFAMVFLNFRAFPLRMEIYRHAFTE